MNQIRCCGNNLYSVVSQSIQKEFLLLRYLNLSILVVIWNIVNLSQGPYS